MRKVLIILVFVSFYGCEKLLDVDPKAQINTDEAFTSKENIEAVMVGCYNALQYQHYYGRNFIILGDILSDNSFANGTKLEYYNLDEHVILSDNIVVEGVWADIYAAINSVNFAIEGITHARIIEDEIKADYLGQLYFLRALHYFNLVRLYGDVPLKLQPTIDDGEQNYMGRTSSVFIYEKIISDVEKAINDISNTDITKATVLSAQLLEAKVLLTLKNYSQTVEKSQQIIENDLPLEESYTNLFGQNAKQSPEMIFYIPYSDQDKNRLAEYHYPYQLGGRHENAPSQKLLDITDSTDQRLPLIAAKYNDQLYTNKYADISNGSDGVIVFRYAEALFINLEAKYFLDSIAYRTAIINGLNTIRTRSALDSIPSNFSGSLLDAIHTEKQLEFAFEGKRWFDLIRINKAIEQVTEVSEVYQYLLPIPLSEILANPKISNADQNPGY